MPIESPQITEELIDLVTDTANDIVKAHGWFVSIKREDVKTILQALKILQIANSVKRMSKTKVAQLRVRFPQPLATDDPATYEFELKSLKNKGIK